MINQTLSGLTLDELESAKFAAESAVKSSFGTMIRGEMREMIAQLMAETGTCVTAATMDQRNFDLGQKSAFEAMERAIFGLPELIESAKQSKMKKE